MTHAVTQPDIHREITTERPPTVSIVITCYRQAHFLPDAIDSARAQTYTDLEIIVVDDGSPDDTSAVVGRYTDVRLVRRHNGGLSAARNSGLAAARGDYIAFLDADDVLRPDAVAVSLREFAAEPGVTLVAGSYVLVDEALRPLAHQPEIFHLDSDAYITFLRRNPIGMHAAVLYRREAVAAAGGFDPELQACEDYDMYLRLSRSAPIRLHGTVIAEYRRHGDNMSHDNALMLTYALRALRRQRPHLRRSASRAAAYRAGRGGWLDSYLGPALQEVRSAPTVGSAVARGAHLLRIAPWRTLTASVRRAVHGIGRRLVPTVPRVIRRPLRRWIGVPPPVGAVDLGDLRRLAPISDEFGFDRGRPIDRYYIERFLAQHAADVRGHVMEIGDADYTRRFGGDDVLRSEVLHVTAGNPAATLVGDLTDGDHLPSAAFDCIILTQTLHLIHDVRAALATAVRMLRRGGTLLVTVPGISQIDRGEWHDTWSWAITPQALDRLLRESSTTGEVTVEAHGNVLAATAFLHGLADTELRPEELDVHDPAYPVLVTGRLVRS